MNKKLKKVLGFIVLAFVLVPMINVRAEGIKTNVGTEEELRNALVSGGDIVLTGNIEVKAPLYANVAATIDGAGFTISASDTFTNDGANGSILAVMNGAEVVLNDITINKAVKYGVQAYDGGIVSLNGVTITNSGFGAVLINGGGLIVLDLTMNDNTFGIEFGKGAFVTNEPAMLMNGTISGNQVDPIVLATNDNLGEVVVGNMPDSEMKLAVDGKKLVLKDKDGTVVATSNEANSGVVVKEEAVDEPIPTPTPTPVPDNTPSENPNTNDNVGTYIVLAILGFSALAFSSKKVLHV